MGAIKLDTESAEKMLAQRWKRIAEPTKYIAGFETPAGRQIALERNRKSAIFLWIEDYDRSIPGIEVSNRQNPGNPYEATQSRNSNLNQKNAPRLQFGRRAFNVKLTHRDQLHQLMEWYEGGRNVRPQPESASLPAKQSDEMEREEDASPGLLAGLDSQLETGLVIDEPYIDQILEGRKTWEMRSRKTARRGWIALIRKGSGTVVGVARLADVKGPLVDQEMRDTRAFHQLGDQDIADPNKKKWRTAWIFDKVVPLDSPVPYRHKPGAVTWVRLEPEVRSEIAAKLDSNNNQGKVLPGNARHAEPLASDVKAIAPPATRGGTGFAPPNEGPGLLAHITESAKIAYLLTHAGGAIILMLAVLAILAGFIFLVAQGRWVELFGALIVLGPVSRLISEFSKAPAVLFLAAMVSIVAFSLAD